MRSILKKEILLFSFFIDLIISFRKFALIGTVSEVSNVAHGPLAGILYSYIVD